MGTLYRRFPTKAALVEAIFEEHLDRLAALAEEALARGGPWRGLAGFLERTVALQAENRGFAAIVAVHLRDEKLLAAARRRVTPLVRQLRRAGAGGGRAAAGHRPRGHLGALLDERARGGRDPRRRAGVLAALLALALDGCAPQDATKLPHPPLTASQHREAMERLASQFAGCS